MKKLTILVTTGLLMMLAACGNNDQSPVLPEEDSSVSNSIVVEKSVDMDDSAKTDDFNKEEEIMDGERFYDQEVASLESAGDTCFMQPILQNPTSNSVTVQWFTEEEGKDSRLILFGNADEEVKEDSPERIIQATTVKLSRIRGGKDDDSKDDASIKCDIYKHVAIVDELPEYHGFLSQRRYYRVQTGENQSDIYTLSAQAAKGTPMRILLTSDHQLKDMVAANIQKVYETVGPVDAVLVNGDLVDVTDRCYDWFYADNAFFRCLTGTAKDEVNGSTYIGAPFLQQAPMYTAIGNHDVMGVYDETTPLSTQFNEPRTRQQAERKWDKLASKDDFSHDEYVENHSYNTITSEEMFENPASYDGGEKYYAVSMGDVRLICLDISRVWRLPNIGLGGKYSEIPGSNTDDYAEGEFIFESIKEGSEQVKFLDEELVSDEYKNAAIKMVMFHSEAHALGGNQIPAFTDPVPKKTTSPITGQDMTIYDYPIGEDYIRNVIEPRLEKSGTNLLFEAHSHIWNRFVSSSGMNILESSNVGNSYGGFDSSDNSRTQYPSAFDKTDQYHAIGGEWNKDNYVLMGDPNKLEAVMPNKSNLPDSKAYLDSNTITAFSILDTATGTVDSYYYDTNHPESEVVFFDSFEVIAR